MFRRPFRVRSSTKVRTSDRRKLREDVKACFVHLDEDTLDLLAPSNKQTDIMVNQVTTAKGERITVYFIEGQPCFFTEPGGRLYPTVYTLWKHPDPTAWECWHTWDPVFKKIVQGADLMLPGVIVPAEGLTPFQEGEMRGLQVRGRGGAPLAVGRTATDAAGATGMRGKGLIMLHCQGDQLWESGTKDTPPAIPEFNLSLNEQPIESTSSSVAGGAGNDEGIHGDGEGAGKDSDADSSVSASPAIDVDEADETYRATFLWVLAGDMVTDDILPLSASTLVSRYMSAFDTDLAVDIRHTSYRKIGKFLKAMEKRGYVRIKDVGGVPHISAVEWDHQDIADLGGTGLAATRQPKKTASDAPDSDEISYDVVEIYGPHKGQWEVLGKDPATKELFKSRAVKEAVKDYVEKQNLMSPANKKTIVLDEVMMTALKTTDQTCPRDQIMSRFLAAMKSYHIVTKLIGGKPVKEAITPKKGAVPKIVISNANRTGTKKITRVRGLHTWTIVPQDFASAVQKCTASGASLGLIDGTQADYEVIVQGNRGLQVMELLSTDYKVPAKYIDNQCKVSKR